MNVLNLFNTHKVVEVNLSTGLRTGHMLAQHKYEYAKNGAVGTVDNGCFFRMSKANPDQVVLADNSNAVGDYFLHYTEELFTTGLVDSFKYFAVECDEEVIGATSYYYCYPRCIALYTGDTFTTDNYNVGSTTLANAKFALVGPKGIVTLYDSIPASISGGYTGPLFQAVKSTLPDGTDAVQLTVLDTKCTIASA